MKNNHLKGKIADITKYQVSDKIVSEIKTMEIDEIDALKLYMCQWIQLYFVFINIGIKAAENKALDIVNNQGGLLACIQDRKKRELSKIKTDKSSKILALENYEEKRGQLRNGMGQPKWETQDYTFHISTSKNRVDFKSWYARNILNGKYIGNFLYSYNPLSNVKQEDKYKGPHCETYSGSPGQIITTD